MTRYTIAADGLIEISDFAVGDTVTIASDTLIGLGYEDTNFGRYNAGSTAENGTASAVIASDWLTIRIENWTSEGAEVTIEIGRPASAPRYFGARKYTGPQLSGIDLPIGSDRDIKVNIELIGEASDLRRTINADLINLSRAVFRKYFANVTGAGLRAAALAGLTPGDYVELIAPEPLSISCRSPLSAVELPRAGIDVVGLTAEGERVQPDSQPASPLPLQIDRTAARIADLRQKPVVTFSTPVVSVRYRAALACAVVSWSSDSDERMAASNWSLSLEEI